MSPSKNLLCGVFLLSFVLQALGQDCLINTHILDQKHPLFLNPDNHDIIYPPEKSSVLSFKANEQFELNCPGKGKIKIDGFTFGDTAIATCISDEYIAIESQQLNVSTAECTSRITTEARYTSKVCWEKYREIEVGFMLPEDTFWPLYTVCFDDVAKITLYSTFKLMKNIDFQPTGNSRPGWSDDDFYNLEIPMNTLYTKNAQRKTINKLLGLSSDDTTYIQARGTNYLAKGHLTANADFFYSAEQQSTFHYVNAAPQWQSFNGFNWKYLEEKLRKYVADKYVDLTVYTGTYGIANLPSKSTGESTDLYIYEDSQGNKAIPVPGLFWKVAYDPAHKAGVALLGINNPYQTDLDKSILCNDISQKISWLDYNLTDVDNGYMYACTVTDLRKIIPNIPNFKITKLLT